MHSHLVTHCICNGFRELQEFQGDSELNHSRAPKLSHIMDQIQVVVNRDGCDNLSHLEVFEIVGELLTGGLSLCIISMWKGKYYLLTMECGCDNMPRL